MSTRRLRVMSAPYTVRSDYIKGEGYASDPVQFNTLDQARLCARMLADNTGVMHKIVDSFGTVVDGKHPSKYAANG